MEQKLSVFENIQMYIDRGFTLILFLYKENKLLVVYTYPNSTMPSANSFFVNSHCVAALNFQAMINTFKLAGSKSRSSQNLAIPSAIILSSSAGSTRQLNTNNLLTIIHQITLQVVVGFTLCV